VPPKKRKRNKKLVRYVHKNNGKINRHPVIKPWKGINILLSSVLMAHRINSVLDLLIIRVYALNIQVWMTNVLLKLE
jgi:hypothetical protein